MTTTAKQKRQSWGVGRAAFLAHAAAICAEIDQGWPMTIVYQKFKDRVGLGYRQFIRHVKAHQYNQKKAAQKGLGAAPAAPVAARATASAEPRQAPVREATGGGYGQRQFQYDATVNKNDLI
jgi:hypothetical protein